MKCVNLTFYLVDKTYFFHKFVNKTLHTMNTADQNTFGNRLKLARKMAGMSLQDLSDALGNKVTKQSLNKYELGEMKPTSEVLLMLSKTLNVKPDYFLKKDSVELGEVLFRKRASLSKKIEDAIVEKVRDYVERYLEIENILSIQSKFVNPLKSRILYSRKDVEDAANELRKVWELGNNPIPNLVEMLELKGIKVLLIKDVDDIDGLAVLTSTGIPVVVVNVNNKSVERIRFTIIHELAHLLLDLTPVAKEKKQEEIFCHLFATCFLIPSDQLKRLIGQGKRGYINIKELESIKEYYGISIRAILHRLKDMEVITEVYYQKWMVWLTKNYGAKNEPGKYQGEEKSKGLEQMVGRALSEGIISISKAAALCNTTINHLRKDFISVI